VPRDFFLCPQISHKQKSTAKDEDLPVVAVCPTINIAI
jgi:hypothetical protein